MSLVLKSSGGDNIVLRPQERARYYPPATVEAARVRLGWHYANQPASATQLIGDFPITAKVDFKHYPDQDQNVIFRAIPLSSSGTPGVSNWADATVVEVPMQRVTDPPTLAQEGPSTASQIKLVVGNTPRLARQRRLKIANNSDMDSPIIREFNVSGERRLPDAVTIERGGTFSADFILGAMSDPATEGFTKTGTGTTEPSGDGWRINTESSNDQTYYTKDDFPDSPFEDGFTLALMPPTITSDDADSSEEEIEVRVGNGSAQFRLAIDATHVALNGVPQGEHGWQLIMLVLTGLVLTADLYVGSTQLATGISAESMHGDSELAFGDLSDSQNADCIWHGLSYAFTAVPPALAQTIYVTLAHSGGQAYGAESEVLEVSFADDAGEGGSIGEADPILRDHTIIDGFL